MAINAGRLTGLAKALSQPRQVADMTIMTGNIRILGRALEQTRGGAERERPAAAVSAIPQAATSQVKAARSPGDVRRLLSAISLTTASGTSAYGQMQSLANPSAIERPGPNASPMVSPSTSASALLTSRMLQDEVDRLA